MVCRHRPVGFGRVGRRGVALPRPAGVGAVEFVAAGAVWLTGSGWPDILVALGLVWLLIRSSIRVVSSAMVELRAAT